MPLVLLLGEFPTALQSKDTNQLSRGNFRPAQTLSITFSDVLQ